MKITDAMRGEHGVFYAQFDWIENGLADATLPIMQTQGALLASALAPHAHLEDDLLLAAMERRADGGGPTEVFRNEHAEIESALEALQAARDADGARELMQHALDAARDHFAKEERMLFPNAELALTEGTLTELGEEWAAQRHIALA